MNENDVIKALEDAVSRFEKTGIDGWELALSKDTTIAILDLLKRLKAENEELKCRTQNLTSDLISAKAEVERVEGAIQEWVDGKCLSQKHLLMIGKLQNEIQQAKSEAYREFAERLKCGVPQETGVIRCKDVDFTLTELTERKEDAGK